jgi:uncharacterized protein with von Willebrand factor type A (vWA) domain
MGWKDLGWSKRDRKSGSGIVPWYASGQTAKNWFQSSREHYQNYWRPKFVQPNAAALIQDGWTQSQGTDAAQASWDEKQSTDKQIFADAVDAGDFFSTCFEQNLAFADYTSRPLKAEFIKQIVMSPEFAGLRFQSRFDVAASHLGAVALAKIYKSLRDQEDQFSGQGDGSQGGQEGQDQGQDQDGQDGQGDGQSDQSDGKSNKPIPKKMQDQIRKLANDAIKAAQSEIQTGRELARSFGMDSIGRGQGVPSKLEIQKFIRLYGRLRKNKWLRNVVEFAGRLQKIAKSRAKAKTLYGADQYGGNTLGDDVGRLASEEMAALGMDETEIDVLTRISDEEAHCVQLVGRAEAGKGPILLAVDNSGSMGDHGSDAMTLYDKAVAIALTVAWIARSQRRWVGLYSFTSGTPHRKLILDPTRRRSEDGADLADWITKFDNGGTDDYVITQTIPADVDAGLLGRVRGKADLLVLSDGAISSSQNSEDTIRDVTQWKEKHDIRIKLIRVGGGTVKTKEDKENWTEYLKRTTVGAVSNEIIVAPDITEDSDAAEAVFSLQD